MRLVAIAQLVGFVLAGGGAGGNGGAAERSAFEANVRLDCGIAAGIENLAAMNGDNFRGHHFPLKDFSAKRKQKSFFRG